MSICVIGYQISVELTLGWLFVRILMGYSLLQIALATPKPRPSSVNSNSPLTQIRRAAFDVLAALRQLEESAPHPLAAHPLS